MLDAFGIDAKFILVQAVGFLILVFVLAKYTFGPIYNLLQARQDKIRHDLDEAESRRVEMQRLQREYEERLAQIEDEARDKIQAAVKEAQAAREELIARAQEDSQRIARRGLEDIEREREKAMAEMRDQLAELAVTAASRVIKRNLDAQSHTQLIDEVIAGVGRDGAGPGGSTGGSSGGAR